MSTGTMQAKQAVKDVFQMSPDQLILNRKWNGRWTAILDDSTVEDVGSLADLSENKQVTIRDMAESIRENGQLKDVLVYEGPADAKGRTYRVVAGYSRTRAVAMLNKEEEFKDLKIRCRLLPKSMVKDEKQAFLLNEEENRISNKLDLLDKAYCMQRERDDLGYSAADIAKRWGCTVQAVGQALSLVDLPEEVQQAIHDKIIVATNAVVDMKDLTPEAMKEIVEIGRQARAKNMPFKGSDVKKLAREHIQAGHTTRTAPAPTPAAGATGTGTPQAGTSPTNGATLAPPEKKRRGRKASPEKKVPRGISDLRNVLKGREGVLSQAISRYLDGAPDMTDEVFINVLNVHEYSDGVELPVKPRTEGAGEPELGDEADEADEAEAPELVEGA